MLLRASDLIRELHALGLLSSQQARTAGEDDADPAACAARLVAQGLLTPYQAEQILAGKGRQLVVGPYILLERLGRGGTSHVYKAEHRLMQRVVALKIFARCRGPGAALARRRFRREVRAAARLRHPGIVTAYDAGAARGRPYLAMEHVEGIDLGRLVTDSGPLSVDLACEVVRQAAAALQHAHENGLVHRDVKPSNVLLAPPGVTVKLLDLGLAQFIDTSLSPDEGEPSDPGLCGTPDFMEPERGHDRRADVRADLYGLGCTFYFLLTGRVPHPGGTWTEKLLRHYLDGPAPVAGHRPDVPPEVVAVLERLMARRPAERYPSAAAVVEDLSALVPRATTTRVPGVESPPRPAPLRRPVPLSWGALVAVLLGVAAAGGARWGACESTPPAEPVSRLYQPAFQIEGRQDGCLSLADAVASARDGDVVLVRGPGPFVSPPLSWRGKSLTMRAEGPQRPRLVLKPGDDPWQALFRTDRRLVVEGLELAVDEKPPAGTRSGDAPLICCEGAPLCLTDCRLTGGGAGAAVVARGAPEVIVKSCRIAAADVGLSIEVGPSPCRVRVADTQLSVRAPAGAALSLWAPEEAPAADVRLELESNTIDAGRIAALRSLAAGVTITARDNRFAFRTALVSYAACAESDPWRGTVWQGGGNVYEGPSSWLWVDDRPVSLGEAGIPR